MGMLTRILADVALMARQPLGSFVDIRSPSSDALYNNRGDAMTLVRILGVRRTLSEADVVQTAEGLREDLSGLAEQPGYVQQWWFGSDPTVAGTEVKRTVDATRSTARQLGLDLDMIFDEQERRLPRIMRWEACYLALWTRRSAVLNSEEEKIATAQEGAERESVPPLGDAQDPFIAVDVVADKHRAYVERVLSCLHLHGIGALKMDPRDMVGAIRESIYPGSIGTGWRARLLGDRMHPRVPEVGQEGSAESLLPPSLRDQICSEDANELELRTVQVGQHIWANVDMTLVPERSRPFAELVRTMSGSGIPWRVSLLIEGGGETMFAVKRVAATLLGFGKNRRIWKAIAANEELAANTNERLVKLRVSFATWALAGRESALASQRALLLQYVQSWGNAQVATVAGDPLAGVMSSALAVAPRSTAPATQLPLKEALKMLPYGRPGSPYTHGPVLFKTPDGRMWPYDPVGPQRWKVTNLFSGPSRRGKSVLANTILRGTILSSAAEGADGPKIPLIAKVDIGKSAKGLVVMIQEALPADRKGEAIYVRFDLTTQYAVNIFQTQTGCRAPLELERAFLTSFLSLGLAPLSRERFEGMDMLIMAALTELYRMLGTEGPNLRTKRYEPGLDPAIDVEIAEAELEIIPPNSDPSREVYWWDVVDAFCRRGMYAEADKAQRYAEPILEDLIDAVRNPSIRQRFDRVVPHQKETLCELFERYLLAFIKKYPTLNGPTKVDFGPARIIVLDLEAVAPSGSPENNRQTGLMFMLARHLIGRNFFLHPEYADQVPSMVRPYHRRRFTEVYEAVKILEYDEWQRTKDQPEVQEAAERDDREGAKHGVMLGLSSQRMTDFGDHLVKVATGLFICGVGNMEEADEIIKARKLSEATGQIIRHRLTGPRRDGGGAPFVVVLNASDAQWEQVLVNVPGPIDLWALSTTPEDCALRDRLYERLGASEALQRLSAVFPTGSAVLEINRRKEGRLRRGEDDDVAAASVIEEMMGELYNGTGLGVILRPAA
ncbi:ATP-binding protein [Paeniroseomonas aquatica]|uniref:ATP-binding protein n=2 Tax=Paeniroseomonas aquatica TaxID=373043 RepID=A0ABT8A0N2_9PROT|nr:ATP-binding protein [Paeniroseomonas aquatica]MDN3563099.1 ATP-binding protein [Paeniroseomonas aquatica]